MIPHKSRKEWEVLVKGKITYKFSSFALQMTVARVQVAYRTKFLSLDEGVSQIHDLCEKYSNAVDNDLKNIFKK